jgi:FtsH-binding integral membrane protein
MSQYPNPYGMNQTSQWELAGTSNPAIVRFFNSVYAWMCVGLATTALVAWWASANIASLASFGAGWIVLFIAQIALVMVITRAVNKINTTAATVLFLVYAALNGLTLSVIFLIYAKAALASAFVITAGTFGAMSVYGFVTKRDLSFMGRIMIMGLIGLVIASIVSIFWHNSMLQVAINYIGVIVFVGLTAYDTQKLKVMAQQTQDNPALAARLSVVGSLVLYLDFLNLFLFILELMNDRRR